jgi:rfaE bifunctional protein kinase chain/domain
MDNLENLIADIKGLRVAIIGDIMLDHYIWGDATRISPEAPVPVIDVCRDTYVPGGAANVALNVAALGGKAVLLGRTANDDAGVQLCTSLHAAGVSFDQRLARNEAPTILKTRIVVRNQQLCRVDREEAPSEYSLEEDGDIWHVVEEKLKYVDAVIFSDYSKGIVTSSLVERVQHAVEGRKIFLSMDPKPRRRIKFSGLDLMTPNRTESISLARIELEPHDPFPANDVCHSLWTQYATKNLVITLGGDGMLLSKEGKAVKCIPTVAREVYDVSGAGDTVVAALTMTLARGISLEDSAHFANLAAGVVVSKVGTATATPSEILNYSGAGETAILV